MLTRKTGCDVATGAECLGTEAHNERRVLALDALCKLNRRFASKPDFEQLIQTLLLTLSGQFSVPNVFVVFQRPDHYGMKSMFLATGSFSTDNMLKSLLLTPDIRFFFAHAGQPNLLSDLNCDSSSPNHLRIMRDSGVQVVCPVLQDNELLGVIGFGNKVTGRPFTKIDLDILTTLISSVTPLIASSYQYWKVAWLSSWYREILDGVRQGVFAFGSDNRLKKINAPGLAILKRHRPDAQDAVSLCGVSLEDVFPQEQFRDWARIVVKSLTVRGSANIVTLRTDSGGSEFIYDAYVCVIRGDSDYESDFIVTLDDVSEQWLSRKRLRHSHELLQATLESTEDGILAVDNDGKVTHWNSKFASMWNIPHELLEMNEDGKLLDYVLGQLEAPEAFLTKVKSLYQTADEDFETLHFRDDRVFERYSRPLIQDGQIQGRVWSFRDVTKQRQSESALRESEERFRDLANSLPQIVFEMNQEGRLTYVNENAYARLGYSPEEFAEGLYGFQIIAPCDRKRAAQNFSRILSASPAGQIEYTAIRKDGSTFPVAIHSTRVCRDGKPEAVRGIILDLTEQKLAEEQKRELQRKLDRAERMESLGILAGGVAHDLNNMLGPIVGYPELILRSLPEGHPAGKQVRRMGASAREAVDVIQDLLTLARRGRYEMNPVDLNGIIRTYTESLGYLQKLADNPRVSVEYKLDDGILNIMGSAPHLHKVLMNLVLNAFDAMPDGGTLAIETSQACLTRLIGGYDRMKQGDYVLLRIRDNGTGMDPGDLNRIFEPYYSKKKMGRSGSGLGLSVVYGVVRDHKGYYDILSEKGKGTEFILYFPATSEAAESVDDSDDIPGGNETVLVVDDVAEQREICRDLLSSLGYQVVEAENGRAAVKYLSGHAVGIVLLDMIMENGLDGLDTYREILKLHPRQKTIVMSGFSETDRVAEMQKLGAGRYIRKPFTLATLGEAIREELDKEVNGTSST